VDGGFHFRGEGALHRLTTVGETRRGSAVKRVVCRLPE
jgi:hypothetical protein